MNPTKYIAVAGNMGSGKSTLVDFICKHFKLEPFFEPNANNPYLVDFYADMKKWGFHSQIYFLTHKFRIHQELGLQRKHRTVVQDRTIYEDAEIFAQNLYRRRFINKRDWKMYEDLYQTILNAIEPPDLMIYCKCSLKTVRKRIQERGRPEEQKIPSHYLKTLTDRYGEWRASYKRSPIIDMDTERLDYLSDLIYRVDVLKTIEKHI
jgi:deoxyadenosine/deoxycytidine kinase